jgi:hypothetical protein
LGEGEGVGFLMFSMCSPEIPTSFQHVPQVHNVFSNMFPISPQFIPYPFALSSNVVTYLYISSPKKEIGTHLFWDYPKLDFIYLFL